MSFLSQLWRQFNSFIQVVTLKHTAHLLHTHSNKTQQQNMDWQINEPSSLVLQIWGRTFLLHIFCFIFCVALYFVLPCHFCHLISAANFLLQILSCIIQAKICVLLIRALHMCCTVWAKTLCFTVRITHFVLHILNCTIFLAHFVHHIL